MSTKLQRAAAILLKHVDTDTDIASHAQLRARVVEAATRPPTRHLAWKFGAIALIPIAVTVAVLMTVVRPPPSSSHAITFAFGAGQLPGTVGSFLTTVGDTSVPLNFSEGSSITLWPGTKARVSQTTDRGATLVLERGHALCNIIHQPATEWNVIAGPYTLEVKGTTFDVGWDEPPNQLFIQMYQGSVRVRGPGIESAVDVRNQQRFTTSVTASTEPFLPTPQPPSGGPSSASSVTTAAPVISPTAGVPRRTIGSEPSAAAHGSAPSLAPPREADSPAASNGIRPPSHESWSSLVSRGEYRRVIGEAEALGIESVLGSASDSDVLAVADAARFLGRSHLATQALEAVRTRFPGTGRAGSAAFLLGRIAEDSGNMAKAISWYDRYLTETPGGPLAPEAMGRRMVALRKLGNTAAAKQSAESYLQRFPGGPYAGLAKEMLGL